MLKELSIKKIFVEDNVFLFAVLLIAIGIPVSKFLTSLGQLILAVFWIYHTIRYRDLKQKLKSFVSNKIAVILSSVFVLHLIGLIHTTDFDYATNDLRIKLPIIVLPLFFSTLKPLTEKRLNSVLVIFILTVFTGTIMAVVKYFEISGNENFDMRDIIRFNSSIRFGLTICFSVFIASWFFIKSKNNVIRLALACFIIWLISFMIFAELMTGLTALISVLVALMIYGVFKIKSIIVKSVSVLILLSISVSSVLYVKYYFDKYNGDNDVKLNNKLEVYTSLGNPYIHMSDEIPEKENGLYVWDYIQQDELYKEWSKVSSYPIDSMFNGYYLSSTLFRYMTSKGLRKDSLGFSKLDKADIRNVEQGITNADFTKHSLGKKVYETIWEIDSYLKYDNSADKSVAQRLLSWRLAIDIIKENFWFGVGTGDVQTSFNANYEKLDNDIEKRLWLRAHNQYLTLIITFGILGLFWVVFAFIYPLAFAKEKIDFIYIVFFIIINLSMLSDDTLETQSGVTLFAFFNSLLLLGREKVKAL